MTIFLTTLHVLVCAILILLVLLQRGKGAEIGAVFGGGASSTLFGSRGAGNFLTKLTSGAAIIFMGTSLWLAVRSHESISSRLLEEEAGSVPAAGESAPAEFKEIPPAEQAAPKGAGAKASAAADGQATPAADKPTPAAKTQKPNGAKENSEPAPAPQ